MADLGLEIYHLDVFGGDSTAILVKNLEEEKDKGGKTIYSMLIDAGAEGSGSSYLKTYLKAHNMVSFDCIVATHYHQDHIQGFSAAEIKFDSFIDIGGYAHKAEEIFTPRNDIGKGARTSIFSNYQKQVQDQVSAKGAKRIPIPFAEKTFELKTATPFELPLGKDTGIKLTCYCANGILADGTDVLGSQKQKKKKDINPNDVSLAMILEWGDFRYLTAGDLSGDESIRSYYNIEEELLKYLMKGPLKGKKITIFKASHHGSEHSNKSDLLTQLSPETIVVSCNIKKRVPSPIFLKRLKGYLTTKTGAAVVFTNTLKVFKNDDRYSELESIKDSIAEGNVAFSGTEDTEQVASNLGIKCAIIRRRMKDATLQDFDEHLKPDKAKITKKTGYEIVLMDRDKDEASAMEKAIRFASFDLKISWQETSCSKALILKDFDEQAKAMVGWIVGRNENDAQVGKDYISEHYPALAKIVEKEETDLEKKLKDEMERMFDKSFTLKEGWFRRKSENNLTSDQKLTFKGLMVNNYYQFHFGWATVKLFDFNKNSKFDREQTWNRTEYLEPGMGKGRIRKLSGSVDERGEESSNDDI